jgi:hypothetical protein
LMILARIFCLSCISEGKRKKMKQSPQMVKAQELMAPGMLVREGFLGTDTRDLTEIIDADNGLVKELGLTNQMIAKTLDEITQKTLLAMGAPVSFLDFNAECFEALGKLPCPFGHPGLYIKAIITVKKKESDEKLKWAALASHMIGSHGFYGGKGSHLRIEPREVATFFKML